MMSIWPNSSTAFWISWSGTPSFVRSPPKTAVSPEMSEAACSATSASRSLMSTRAPCSASSSAVARPIPRADPVTIAAFPSRTPIPSLLCAPAAGHHRYMALNAVRYGIPLVLLIAGVIVSATAGGVGIAAGALFFSAGSAVPLLNVLHRMGVEGDKERDREEAAREYFDKHGRWPGEQSRPLGRTRARA